MGGALQRPFEKSVCHAGEADAQQCQQQCVFKRKRLRQQQEQDQIGQDHANEKNEHHRLSQQPVRG